MLNSNNHKTIIIHHFEKQSMENLIKRGYFALEDKKWKSADSFFEQALDENPECAEAYLGKLMVELRVCQKYDLSKVKKDFSNNSNWKRILNYADPDLISELSQYLGNAIKQAKIKKKKVKIIAKLSSISLGIIAVIMSIIITSVYIINPAIRYNKAVESYNNGEYFSAWLEFKSLDNYKDSSQKADSSYEMYQKSTWISVGDIVLKIHPNASKNICVDNGNIIISNYNNYTINEFIKLISTVEGCALDNTFTVTNGNNERDTFFYNGDTVYVLRKKVVSSTDSNKLPATDISLNPWKMLEVNFIRGTSEIKGTYIKNGETVPFTINVTFK